MKTTDAAHRRVVLAALLIAALANADASLAAQPERSAAGKKILLTLRDVPAGFSQTEDKAHTIAESARNVHVSVPTMRARGWQGSYERDFRRAAILGLVEIDSVAVAFSSSANAHWRYKRGLAQDRKPYKGKRAREMSVGNIGSEGAGFTVTSKRLTVVAVTFRRGRYYMNVLVGGIAYSFDPAKAVSFARIMDRRAKRDFPPTACR